MASPPPITWSAASATSESKPKDSSRFLRVRSRDSENLGTENCLPTAHSCCRTSSQACLPWHGKLHIRRPHRWFRETITLPGRLHPHLPRQSTPDVGLRQGGTCRSPRNTACADC